jgi:hypothetical protein
VARDRARFAAVFSTNLGPADEPFLEGLLADRSLSVRSIAAGLLARLPASGLAERTIERLRTLLTLESRFLGSARIVAKLPEAYTPGMAHDGIVEKAQGIGRRAWWLLQMVAAVPPEHWTLTWGRSPADLIALAERTGDAWLLLEGWSRAAARRRDAAWAEALLERWLDRPWATPPSWKATYLARDLGDLVCSVPQERLERGLSSRLNARRGDLSDQERLLALLQHHQRAWGEPLTGALLNGLHRLASREDNAGRAWRMALPDLAYSASPLLADHAGQGWPENRLWTKRVDRFVSTLRFRRRMSNAFS